MVKEIKHNNEVIGLIFKKKEHELGENINFFTLPENSLQTGILKHPKGHIIKPHIHHKIERNITDTQETLYIEEGKIKIMFFDEDKEEIGEEVLEPGDLAVLMKKGHGIEMLEDSKIVYVKQGPYFDRERDKRLL